jgi:hypothetical protein
MAYLNANIPVMYAQIRREYLYDLTRHHGEVEDCVLYSGWHRLQVVLSCFMQLWKMGLYFIVCLFQPSSNEEYNIQEVPRPRLDELELWNCFSYYPAITSYDLLDGQSGKYLGKDKQWHKGAYLFTVDWAHPESNIVDTDHSEIPHEHKCAHIMALEDGNYAAQPNNRIIWSIPSFTVKDKVPFDWKVQTSEWNVEDDMKWKTEDSDRFFYNVEEKKDD